jgi:flagellar hook-length control protein FliK
VQTVQPSKPVVRTPEAPVKDDSGAAERGFAAVAAPDALLAANPQALGGSPPPHLQTPVQSSLPPKTAQALHAQVPAVIEHLHHGGAHDGHGHAEVLLNPAELGRIRFDLITQGDQVQISLTVERPETLDLMRAHAETLRQEFRAAGLNTDTLNFGQWDQRAPSRDQPVDVLREKDDPADLPQIISPAYVKPVSASGLDLRL